MSEQKISLYAASSSHNKLIGAALLVFVALFAVFLSLIAALFIGAETGFLGLCTGVVCATLPVPIYIALLLWIDRFEPEPIWLLTLAFLWGGLVSFNSSFIFNTFNSIVVYIVSHSEAAASAGGAMFSAPLVEESTKGLFLLILFYWRKADFDGVVDGIVYAGMIALGFAMTENMLYYGREFKPEGHLAATIFIRGFMSPFAHPLFTSMTGIGLGWARETNNVIMKWIAPLCGLAMAMFLHFVWNSSGVIGNASGFLLTYFLFMVPVFFAVLLVVVFALLREARMISQNLKPELEQGVLNASEVRTLASITGRLGGSFSAFFSGGFGGWLARRRFYEAASHLAFHRNRVIRGTVKDDIMADARETELVRCLINCKTKVSA